MNKQRVNELAHVFAGLILLFHGFDAFEAGDFKSASGYLSLGLLYMVVAGLHKTISKKFVQGNAAFFLLESVTIVYSGWHYKTKGHPYLYYLMTAAGIMFFILSCHSFISEDKPRKKKHRKRRRQSSTQPHLHSHHRSSAGSGKNTSADNNASTTAPPDNPMKEQ
jgi:hypothetical protein